MSSIMFLTKSIVKKILLIFIIMSFVMFGMIAKQKEQQNNKQTIAIIPPFNAIGNEQWDYISNQLDNALNSYLLQTDGYTVLDPTTIKKTIQKNNLDQNQILWPDIVVKMGKILNADIVIYGFYVLTYTKVNIYFKSVEIQTGKINIDLKESGENNIEMPLIIQKAALKITNKILMVYPPKNSKIKKLEKLAILPVISDDALRDRANTNRITMELKILSYNKYELLENTNIQDVTQDMTKPDVTNDALINFGSKLQVDYIVQIKVKSDDYKIIVSYKIADVKNNKVLIKDLIIIYTDEELSAVFDNIANMLNSKNFVKNNSNNLTNKNDNHINININNKKYRPNKNTKLAISFINIGSSSLILSGFSFGLMGYFYSEKLSSKDYTSYTTNNDLVKSFFGLGMGFASLGLIFDILSAPFFVKGLNADTNISKKTKLAIIFNTSGTTTAILGGITTSLIFILSGARSSAIDFNTYQSYDAASLSLAIVGLSLVGVGVILDIVSIPFFVKGRKASVSLNIEYNKVGIAFAVNI